MTQVNQSVIVQLLFVEAPALDFSALVTELGGALDQASGGRCCIDRDHDDIAIFEAGGCRFLLGIARDPGPGIAACLTLSVGPAPGFLEADLPMAVEPACRLIISRLCLRYVPDHQRWYRHGGSVSIDEIDALHEDLGAVAAARALTPAFGGHGPRHDLINHDTPDHATSPSGAPSDTERAARKGEARSRPRLTSPRPRATPINGRARLAPRPWLPGPNDAVIRQVRAALYPVAEAPPTASVPLRIAAHSLDTTMIIAAPPIGAAMLTYSLLRGADATVSARMMALTGTFVGLSQVGLTVPLITFL